MGNHNHLPEGLPEGSFCGVGTWLPKRPTEPNMSSLPRMCKGFQIHRHGVFCLPVQGYFGNPAMKFRRLSSQAAGLSARSYGST